MTITAAELKKHLEELGKNREAYMAACPIGKEGYEKYAKNAERGKSAQRAGATAEWLFDQWAKSYPHCWFASIHPRRNKEGRYIEKGTVDRIGILHGRACAIEIKSAKKKWSAGDLPEHEWTALCRFFNQGGISLILVRDGQFEGWRIGRLCNDDHSCRVVWDVTKHLNDLWDKVR